MFALSLGELHTLLEFTPPVNYQRGCEYEGSKRAVWIEVRANNHRRRCEQVGKYVKTMRIASDREGSHVWTRLGVPRGT